MKTIPIFDPAQLEAISRELGEALTGSQLDRFLLGLKLPLSSQSTKWKRIYESLSTQQATDGHGDSVACLIKQTMAPVRFTTEPERFDEHRGRLNLPLGFVGLILGADGKLYRRRRATTLSEAQARAHRLRITLSNRDVHEDVLRYCRAELVEHNYFHAVFEATKSVAEKIRNRTGLSEDGTRLIEQACGRASGTPALAFNLLRTRTEENEHDGLTMLLKGLFSAFRNTAAHAPRIEWPIGERDAVDVLALASLLHRRLDDAHVTPSAPAFRTSRPERVATPSSN